MRGNFINCVVRVPAVEMGKSVVDIMGIIDENIDLIASFMMR